MMVEPGDGDHAFLRLEQVEHHQPRPVRPGVVHVHQREQVAPADDERLAGRARVPCFTFMMETTSWICCEATWLPARCQRSLAGWIGALVRFTPSSGKSQGGAHVLHSMDSGRPVVRRHRGARPFLTRLGLSGPRGGLDGMEQAAITGIARSARHAR